MTYLWNLLFYKPLYNILVFLINHVPNYSIFIAVIILTIIVRLIIFPLSYKSIRTQLQTKVLQPELDKIKKEVADKQEQAKLTLELYKKYNVNPFSSFLVMLIQLPIILALYWVIKNIGAGVNGEVLYSFVKIPAQLNFASFGVHLAEKSYILAFLTGFTQYIYLSISSSMKNNSDNSNKSEQAKMMVMVGKSMKYTMPIMITVFSYIVGGAVAIYWVTSNIFMIFQELYIQKKLKKEKTIL